MLVPDAEGIWLASLTRADRALFLATLAHQLTVAGRDADVPGTPDFVKALALIVLDPSDPELVEWTSWAWDAAKDGALHGRSIDF